MEALILSCSTGGGHNAAGNAIKEELTRRGHQVTMLDPYSLAGHCLDRRVGNGYIKIAQKSPRFFGFIYQLGDWYRTLPVHSPVYQLNQTMYPVMQEFLSRHSYDVIFMPHIYPGEILTYMKNRGCTLPKTIFIATDYTCIPFTEEIDCDYYITPSQSLNEEFIRRGISPAKLLPLGIPVSQSFCEELSREEAMEKLGLDPAKRYLLLSGGSIGAGKIEAAIQILIHFLKSHSDFHLIVICGNHQTLFDKLQKQYGTYSESLTLLTSTTQMAYYMKACDAFISKPGGLSSTEAAAAGIPLIHITPIPGCETKNMEFFQNCGMSLAVGEELEELPNALEQLNDPVFREKMKKNQQTHLPASAAVKICNFAEAIAP